MLKLEHGKRERMGDTEREVKLVAGYNACLCAELFETAHLLRRFHRLVDVTSSCGHGNGCSMKLSTNQMTNITLKSIIKKHNLKFFKIIPYTAKKIIIIINK